MDKNDESFSTILACFDSLQRRQIMEEKKRKGSLKINIGLNKTNPKKSWLRKLIFWKV
ncbi:hypothetical protein IL099_003110 [Enterococcus hirae]|nr:hypothetical protein [Enterococcus hirae]EMF0422130.1 hypothetical protein [Enterococcus hirae]